MDASKLRGESQGKLGTDSTAQGGFSAHSHFFDTGFLDGGALEPNFSDMRMYYTCVRYSWYSENV